MLSRDEKLALTDVMDRAGIARELAKYYTDKQDYENAIRWVGECLGMTEAAHPDLTDGKTLRARLEHALILRKAQRDSVAVRQLRDVVRAMEQMAPEEREKLDAADKALYKDAVREFSRTYLIMGDKQLARDVIKKIRESLPEKVR